MATKSGVPLQKYFISTALDRLRSRITGRIFDGILKIQSMLDQSDRVLVLDILNVFFPYQTRPSANASLNKLLRQFNEEAEAACESVRIRCTSAKNGGADKRWLWFEGTLIDPIPFYAPEFDAIPADRLLDGQCGIPLYESPRIAILTVNIHETVAILEVFHVADKEHELGNKELSHINLGNRGGADIFLAISELGSGAVGGSHNTCKDIIDKLHPIAIIAGGVAFGLDDEKQHIGDVLISTQLVNYELQRVGSSGIIPRGSKPDASSNLLKCARTINAYNLSRSGYGWPRVKFGPLLSGEKLIDSVDYRDSILANAKEAIGGEMEGSGVYASCSPALVDWIIIKAICDFADGKKRVDKEEKQITAAKNAAIVIRDILDSGVVDGLVEVREQALSSISRRSSIVPKLREARKRFDIKAYSLDDLNCISGPIEESEGINISLASDALPEAEQNSGGVDVLAAIQSWVENRDSPPLFILLGEYGMGKTITCQRFVKVLNERREHGESLPLPLYFDLKNVQLGARTPTASEAIEDCLRYGWTGTEATSFGSAQVNELIDSGAVMIFDGLDEVLVRLTKYNGQVFTNQLLKYLSEARERWEKSDKKTTAPRCLISCRTQYFRNLGDQKNHFLSENRGKYSAKDYQALLLLPFSEKKVMHFLSISLPEINPEKILEMIRSVHNLEGLSSRPFTMKLIAEAIPDIEKARAEGLVVRGVSLYRSITKKWLGRDNKKHHILPDHKMRLASHLAAEMWRKKLTVMPVMRLESWLHRWLDEEPELAPRYRQLNPEQLEEDLRTATFLSRRDAQNEDDSGFRFAHSSLMEFFLASYLFEAIRSGKVDRWAMPIPSSETLDFLGQLLEESEDRSLIDTISRWRKEYRESVSEIILAYSICASEKNLPTPILHGADFRGAKLRGLRFGSPDQTKKLSLRFDLVDFSGADLRDARFYSAKMEGVIFSNAKMDLVEFHDCDLRRARFDGSNLIGANFRKCRILGSTYDGASAHRCIFLLCDEKPRIAQSAGSLCYPDKLSESIQTFKERRLFYNPSETMLSSVTFSPDGSRILSGGGNVLQLWDAGSGECLRVYEGHTGWIRSCAFSPDGSRLLSGGDDNVLRLWGAGSGECLRVYKGHTGLIWSCAFSPDGSRLLSCGDDNVLRLWDAGSSECLRVYEGHTDQIMSCAFSPDSSRLLSGGADYVLRLWDAGSSECLRVYEGHTGYIWSCAFSPDGSRIFSGGDDNTLRLWDAGSGECLRVYKGHTGSIRSCAFSTDGSRFLSGGYDNTLRLWDAGSGECLRVYEGHTVWIRSCAFSPDGSRLLSGGDDNVLRLWDAGSGECLRVYEGHTGSIRSCAFSPDGSRLLSDGGDTVLRLWDAGSGECLRVYEGHTDTIWSCAFSPDGSRLLSGGADNVLRLWDAGSSECLRVYEGHTDTIWSCAFSPDGSRLLSGGNDNVLRLWDAGSSECLRVYEGHTGWIRSCAFSPDGSRILSGSVNTLRLWDAGSGECLRVYKGHTDSIWSCAFSPDGSRLLSGGDDNVLQLWDAGSGKCLRVYEGHTGLIRSCAFSPDGSRLLSGGDDNVLRLWDAGSSECLRVYEGHTGQIMSCAFSPDGSRLLSGGADNVLRLWDAESGECLRIHVMAGKRSYAVCVPQENTIIEAYGEIWRFLRWQVMEHGEWMPIPLESFGELPSPKRYNMRNTMS